MPLFYRCLPPKVNTVHVHFSNYTELDGTPSDTGGDHVDRDTEIEFLREALRRRVEKTSVRQVAAEVKMSHGGVYNLVAGTVVPYGKTLAKLRAWYLEQSASGGAGLTVPAARYLIDQMLAAVPQVVRPAAAAELLENLTAVHGRFGVPAPPWVHQLRGALEEEAGKGG